METLSATIERRVEVLREHGADLTSFSDGHRGDTTDSLVGGIGSEPAPCDLITRVEDVEECLAIALWDVPEKGDEDFLAGDGDLVELKTD